MLRESLLDNFINSPFEPSCRLFSPFAEQLFQSLQPQRATNIKSLQLKGKKGPTQSMKKDIFAWQGFKYYWSSGRSSAALFFCHGFVSLSLQQRQRVTLISDEAIVEMLIRYRGSDQHTKISIERLSNSTEGFVLRTCRYHSANPPSSMSSHLRIMCLSFPVLFLTPAYLNSPDQFMKDLDAISTSMIFEYYPRTSTTGNPFWFSNLAFNTVDEWLCYEFERKIEQAYHCKSQERVRLGIEKGYQLVGFFENRLSSSEKQKIMNDEMTSFLETFRSVLELRPCDLTFQNLKILKQQMHKVEELYNQEKSILVIEEVGEKEKKSKRKRKKKNNVNGKSQESEVNSDRVEDAAGNQNPGSEEKITSEENERGEEEGSASRSGSGDMQKEELEPPKAEDVEGLTIKSSPMLPSSPMKEDFVCEDTPKIPQALQAQQATSQQPSEIIEQYPREISHSSHPLQQSFSQTSKPSQQPCQPEQYSQYNQDPSATSDLTAQSLKKKRKPKHRRTKKLPPQLLSSITNLVLCNTLHKFVDHLSTASNNLIEPRTITFQRIRFFIMKLYGEYTVDAKLFGSSAAGLALPTSDIDILLTGFSLETQEEGAGLLGHLAERLKKMGWVKTCEGYLGAKVPIVKLEVDPRVGFLEVKEEWEEGVNALRGVKEVLEMKTKIEGDVLIKVDITVQAKKAEYSHLGCMSTDFMKRWLEIIPNLNPILLILKYLMSMKGLNRPYKGGLSSYCLMIMVAAYLKQTSLTSSHTLSEDLLSILTFYSQQFDNESTSLSLIHSQPCFFKTGDEKHLINIIDPLNFRVLTRNCTEYVTIKEEFRKLRKALMGVYEVVEGDLMGLPVTEIRTLREKKKAVEKWVRRYDGVREVQIEDIIKAQT